MTAADDPQAPSVPADATLWLRPRMVVGLGVVLAAAAIGVTTAFLWHERGDVIGRDLQRVETLARLTEGHASQTLALADIALASLADSVADAPPGAGANALLVQAQQGLSVVRSFTLVDDRGRVVASSVPDDLGTSIDLRGLELPSPEVGESARMGRWLEGRTLHEARTLPDEKPASAHHFIPLVRALEQAHGGRRYLIAALNMDYFSNEHPLILGDQTLDAALISPRGRLISVTEGLETWLGTRGAPGTSSFGDLLAAQKLQGVRVGPGLNGRPSVIAYRALRTHPLTVVIERDLAITLDDWNDLARWSVGTCSVILALLLATVRSTLRNLRVAQRLQRALHASERNLRQTIESLQELVFRTDAAGRIVFANGRWAEFLGADRPSIVGQRLSALCAPADREAVEGLFDRERAASDTPLVLEIAGSHGPKALQLSVTPMQGERGQLAGYAGFAIDITELRDAQNRLQAGLRFSERLLQINPSPIYVKDAAGRYQLVNQAGLELLGLQVEDVIGHSVHELQGAQAALHEAQDRLAIETNAPVRYEAVYLRQGREPRETVLTKVPLHGAGGAVTGLLVSVMDVTEFRKAERAIRLAKEAAEKTQRAQAEFIAYISHELRTPLHSVIGFADLGRDMAAPDDPLRELFHDIHLGGDRMLQLVNGLLDLARLEAKGDSLTLEPRDLVQVVGEVVHELQPLALRQGVVLKWDPAQSVCRMDMDVFRLQQVIRNLLANALRFSPAGSSIDIGCATDDPERVILLVRDHGPGVPAGEHENIFRPFSQAARATKTGTGLGLTISRRIVSAHGGTLTAHDAPGGGALFRVVLPRRGVPRVSS